MVDIFGFFWGTAQGVANFINWIFTGVDNFSKTSGVTCQPYLGIDNLMTRVPANLQCKLTSMFAGALNAIGVDPGSGVSLWIVGLILLIFFVIFILLLYKLFKKYIFFLVIVILIFFIWRAMFP